MLRELLRPKQGASLLDQADRDLAPDNKYAGGPDSAAIRKTPGAYVTHPVAPQDPIKDASAAVATADMDARTAGNGQDNVQMTDVLLVKKQPPVTPETQALNAALKEVARLLTQALPISKRLRLTSSYGTLQLGTTQRCLTSVTDVSH